MVALVIVLMILGLGIASLLGYTPDSRHPDYGLGGLVGRTPDPQQQVDAVSSRVGSRG